MTRYWALALIVAVVALLWAARRGARQPQAEPGDEQRAQGPHGDGERELVELDAHVVHSVRADASASGDLDDNGDLDDTAPAVLSPPEWTPPKSASNGSRR
jgi:hypothetical protein